MDWRRCLTALAPTASPADISCKSWTLMRDIQRRMEGPSARETDAVLWEVYLMWGTLGGSTGFWITGKVLAALLRATRAMHQVPANDARAAQEAEEAVIVPFFKTFAKLCRASTHPWAIHHFVDKWGRHLRRQLLQRQDAAFEALSAAAECLAWHRQQEDPAAGTLPAACQRDAVFVDFVGDVLRAGLDPVTPTASVCLLRLFTVQQLWVCAPVVASLMEVVTRPRVMHLILTCMLLDRGYDPDSPVRGIPLTAMKKACASSKAGWLWRRFCSLCCDFVKQKTDLGSCAVLSFMKHLVEVSGRTRLALRTWRCMRGVVAGESTELVLGFFTSIQVARRARGKYYRRGMWLSGCLA